MNNSAFYEKFKDLSQDKLDYALFNACYLGNFEEVKYLLTSTEIKKHANIHSNNSSALNNAAQRGFLNIVEYLLTSPELKEHADITHGEYSAISLACTNGHLEVISFLFALPEAKNRIDAGYDTDYFFQTAFHQNQEKLLHYFIFKLNMEKTEKIKKTLDDFPSSLAQQVNDMFSLREFNAKLEKELSSDKINKKKPKI